MNMNTNINPAPDATESDAIRSETFTITYEELSRLEPTEMRDLLDGLNLASESLCGILCRPRCSTEDARGFPAYHSGADIIERLLDHLDRCTSMVVEAAEKSQPKNARELTCKAWIALRNDARHEDGLEDFSALAAQLTAYVKRKSWELEVRS